MPRLFRRRHVWLPTAWGALVLLAVAVAVVGGLVRGVAFWLAPTEPAVHDGGARTLVVEGWLDDTALDDAVPLIRSGRYQRVVTSGGPIETWREIQPWRSTAERAVDYLHRHGSGDTPLIAVPLPAFAQNHTYHIAVGARDWMRANDGSFDAVDVFSASVHARRSRLVYRIAFGAQVEVGVLAAAPRGYTLDRWWATSEGAKAVVGEVLSLGWTSCCFWPANDAHTTVPKTPT